VNSRRLFLAGLIAGAATGLKRPLRASQHSSVMGPHPPPQDNRPEQPTPSNPGLPQPDKQKLGENQNEIRKDVDRLYTLAADLKAEVARTDPNDVLSTTIVKRAQEIEKLAKNIKARSKP
jgi:hypothetical protein